MEEFLKRAWEDIWGRLDGPFTFRLILQPLVAASLAIRAGLRDERAGRSAFFWTLVTDTRYSRELLRDGWKDVSRVFILAFVMDLIYEIAVFRWVYIGQSLVVAAVLALMPYLLIRGLSNRIVGHLHHTAAFRPHH
jgi:hypothetical protein